jgi:hypothetical protein
MTKEDVKMNKGAATMLSEEEEQAVSGGTQNEEDYAVTADEICPYCGSPVIFRSSEGIIKGNPKKVKLYVCLRYPACNAYVRVHEGTRIPVGELATPELRSLRRQAHLYFDQLYLSGLMSKQVAYQWLSEVTCTPPNRAHIGYLREYNCQLVIEESKKLLDEKHIPYPNNEEARCHGSN